MSVGEVKAELGAVRESIVTDIEHFDSSTQYLQDTDPSRCTETVQELSAQILLLAGIVKEKGNVLAPVGTGARANFARVQQVGDQSNDPNIPIALTSLAGMGDKAEAFGASTVVMQDKLQEAGAHLAACLQALREFDQVWVEANDTARGSEFDGMEAVDAIDTYIAEH